MAARDDSKHWDKVAAYCRANLIDAVRDAKAQQRLRDWLKAAEEDSLLKLFWINLYIDLTDGALNADKVCSILCLLPDAVHVQESLGTFTQHNPDMCLCQNLKGPAPADDSAQYVRVMSGASFDRRYLRPLYHHTGDMEDLLEIVGTLAPPATIPLPPIPLVWRGKLDLVFVTRYDALVQRTQSFSNPCSADVVADLMALDYAQGELLVYIIYPCLFAEGRVFQPTVLDSGGSIYPFFISARSSDHWGKTCASTSGGDGMPERVHRSPSCLPAGYSFGQVGRTTRLILVDMEHLVREAFSRAFC